MRRGLGQRWDVASVVRMSQGGLTASMQHDGALILARGVGCYVGKMVWWCWCVGWVFNSHEVQKPEAKDPGAAAASRERSRHRQPSRSGLKRDSRSSSSALHHQLSRAVPPSLDYPDVASIPLPHRLRLFYYVHSIHPSPPSSTELRLHFAPSDPHECYSSSSPKLSGVHLPTCSHLSILQRIPLPCRSSRSSHWRYEHRGKDCLPRAGSLGRP